MSWEGDRIDLSTLLSFPSKAKTVLSCLVNKMGERYLNVFAISFPYSIFQITKQLKGNLAWCPLVTSNYTMTKLSSVTTLRSILHISIVGTQ